MTESGNVFGCYPKVSRKGVQVQILLPPQLKIFGLGMENLYLKLVFKIYRVDPEMRDFWNIRNVENNFWMRIFNEFPPKQSKLKLMLSDISHGEFMGLFSDYVMSVAKKLGIPDVYVNRVSKIRRECRSSKLAAKSLKIYSKNYDPYMDICYKLYSEMRYLIKAITEKFLEFEKNHIKASCD